MSSPVEESREISCGQGCAAKCIQVRKIVNGYGLWMSPWPGVGYTCPDCIEKIEAARRQRETSRRSAENRARLIEMIGGPQPLEEMTIESAARTFSPDKRPALLEAKEFNPLTTNLYMFGPCGTGKSHLAMGIAIEQCERGRSVAYYTPKSLNREFRRYQLDAEKEKHFLRSLWTVDVFVLDELGIGNATEFALESLQEIIDGRTKNYKNGMVFTSNLDLNELAEVFKSKRIPDRLFGNCRQVFLGGPTFRGLGAR